MATRTWLGTINTDSENAGNWQSGILPVDGDDVAIGPGAINALNFAPAAPLSLSSVSSADGAPEIRLGYDGSDINENLTVSGAVVLGTSGGDGNTIGGGTYNSVNSAAPVTVLGDPLIGGDAVLGDNSVISEYPIFGGACEVGNGAAITGGTFGNLLLGNDCSLSDPLGALHLNGLVYSGTNLTVGGITFPLGIVAGGAPVNHIAFTRDADPTPLTTDTVDSGDTATYHAQALDADDNPLGDPADLAVTGTGGSVTIVPGIYTVKLG
jgi:hypothetical protein